MDRSFEVILTRGPRLRGNHQPVPRRWRDGAIRRAHRSRRSRRARAACGAGDPGDASSRCGKRSGACTGGISNPDRRQHRVGRGGSHRPRSPHGLHGLGDTVNVASRLLNVAQPGQIVASRHTKDAREGFFVFEDLGDFQVKGKTDPVRAYAVVSEIGGRTRLEVSKERGLTPLIGRSDERRRLAEAFQKRAEGGGGIVRDRRRPWRGKIAAALRVPADLTTPADLELETTCLSYGRAMAYRPIVELCRRYLDLPEGCGRTRSGGALRCGLRRSGSRARAGDSCCTTSWGCRCLRSSSRGREPELERSHQRGAAEA